MPEPTLYTLAARIAGSELVLLNALRVIDAPAGIDRAEWTERCDETLDEALDVAALAVWEHMDGAAAAAELNGAA